jgi:hypothetical protein
MNDVPFLPRDDARDVAKLTLNRPQSRKGLRGLKTSFAGRVL